MRCGVSALRGSSPVALNRLRGCFGEVAGVGRRPFAQVLRNSLSGHPPPTGLVTTIVTESYFWSYTVVLDLLVVCEVAGVGRRRDSGANCAAPERRSSDLRPSTLQ